MKLAKNLPEAVRDRLAKTPTGKVSFSNKSLFDALATGADRRNIINWHEAPADAQATAAWMRSDETSALLGDRQALGSSAALVSLDQLVLAQHVINNNGLI